MLRREDYRIQRHRAETFITYGPLRFYVRAQPAKLSRLPDLRRASVSLHAYPHQLLPGLLPAVTFQLALTVSHAIGMPPKRICEQKKKTTYFAPPRRSTSALVCRVSNIDVFNWTRPDARIRTVE